MKDSIAVKTQPRRMVVQTITCKMNREDLFQAISNQLDQWVEQDRQIFSLAHYQGQSLDAISRAFDMDLKEINRILKKCDRELQISLRKYRKDDHANSALSSSGFACLAVS
jgi:DNA-directed RNA polymerase specialized sigma24 family protein